MARIRTLKPEFWTDEKMAVLTPTTRLVFLGLISQADDAGRLVDNVKLLDGLLFPYTDDTCADSLDELAKLGRIVRYRSESGQPLIQLANWTKHQNVQKPSKYTLPAPSEGRVQEPSGDPPETPKRVPVPDPRPTTPDQRPTTASLPREPAAGSGEDLRMRVELEAYADEHDYGPKDRLIANGEDVSAWRTPTGDVVPMTERMRCLKLTDAHLAEPGCKAHTRRIALGYIIAQQFDPITIAPAANRQPARASPTGPVLNTTDPVAVELAHLKREHPEVYADALAEMERYPWWKESTDLYRNPQLKQLIREKLNRPTLRAVK